jgi:hypothetical protein
MSLIADDNSRGPRLGAFFLTVAVVAGSLAFTHPRGSGFADGSPAAASTATATATAATTATASATATTATTAATAAAATAAATLAATASGSAGASAAATTVTAPAAAPSANPTIATLDATLRPARASGVSAAVGEAASAFEPRPAPIPVHANGQRVHYDVLALAVQPGGELRLEVDASYAAQAASGLELRYATGQVTDDDSGPVWSWRAPETPGIHALEIVAAGHPGSEGGATRIERAAAEAGEATDRVRINVLVLHPRSHIESGNLHGFKIGEYASKPLNGLDAYRPPEGFVEVGPGDDDILVSPHFTLGQFLSKQAGTPRFVAFSTPLVLKLEAVLAAANEAGHTTPTFYVMSGFRTPWYNRSIGNTTIYSRHLWGDAADIFIDVDRDGDMDDLDGNGRRDVNDARLLATIVDRVEREGGPGVRPGGLGIYRRNAHHGPFVHIDARGQAARW